MNLLIKKLLSSLSKKLVIGNLSVSAGTVAAASAAIIIASSTAAAVVMSPPTASNAGQREASAVTQSQGEDIAALSENGDILGEAQGSNEQDGLNHDTEMTDDTDREVEEMLKAAHYHSLTTATISESTCMTSGSAADACADCDYVRSYELPLKEHNIGGWIIELEATETSEGLRSRYCDNCGIQIASEVIPLIPHEHHYVAIGQTNATCSENGSVHYACSICGSYYDEVIAASGHHYGEQVVEASSCELTGHIYSKCSTCGDTKETGTIAKANHNYSAWVVKVAADCVTEGESERTCSNCNRIESKVTPAAGHVMNESTKTIITNATCTETGELQYNCFTCSETVSEEIAALGHDYVEPVIVDSTCSAEGNKKYTCTRSGCNHSYEEVISKKDHTEGDWIIDTAPTCIEAGEKHTQCSICNALINQQTISATGHSFGEWIVTKAPECEKKGIEERTCADCSTVEVRDISALEHDYKDVIDTQPTCTLSGTKHMECSVCQKELEGQTISALGHSFTDYQVVTAATDLSAGVEEATCDNGCNETDTKAIPKLPHTHDYATEKARVAATCTADGYYILECRCEGTQTTTLTKLGHDYELTGHQDADCILDGCDDYKCSRCDDTYSNTIEALGHTSGAWVVTKEATDLAEGTKTRSCTTCGTTLETQTISKLPHTCDFVTLTESQAASCTEDGFRIYQCKCGKTNKTIINKTNHVNAQWTVSKEATYTEMGEEKHICPDCNATLGTRTTAIKPHDHSYSVTTNVSPTCTEKGYTIEACDICGNTKTTEKSATGHSESSWLTGTTPTCETSGYEYTKCQTCNAEINRRDTSATGHSEGSFITDSSATCENDGSKHTECTTCGKTITTETISATGHNMGGFHVTTNATCTNAGVETNSCSNCSYSETKSIPKNLHTYGDWIIDKDATEEADGERHKECSRCGDIITEDIEQLPKHEHSYSVSNHTDATCSNAGSTTYSCDCGDSYSESIVKLSHNVGDWTTTKDATESETGTAVKTCSSCGEIIETKTLDKLPHTHSYTETTVNATCTVDGSITKSCACGVTETITIPATGHNYGTGVTTKPTCTKDGSFTRTCQTCNHKDSTVISATGHNYLEEDKVLPTCLSAGSIDYECDSCGDSYSDTVAKLTHSYQVTSTVDATCSVGGYTLETCENCSNTRKVDETDALGHDDGEWFTTKEAELGVVGEKELRCSECGYVLDSDEIDMLMTDGTDSVYTINLGGGETTIAIGHFDDAQAAQMTALVNAYRESQGVSALDSSKAVVNAMADTRAVETSYSWSHTRPSGLALSYGENIAMSPYDYTGSNFSVEEIFAAWKASSGHNTNMLKSSYTLTSVQVFYLRVPITNSNGEVVRYVYTGYWVQLFK